MKRAAFSSVAALLSLCLPGAALAAKKAPALKLDFLEAPQIRAVGRNPAEIEQATGGRLGIALVDTQGRLLLGFNRDERFAMCSTFKAPLGAAVLRGAALGRFSLDGELSFSKADLLDYSPVVKANIKKGRLSISRLTQAAVEESDNSAANLLLPLIGGPEGLTAFMRAYGDTVSRLDRIEPALNENAPDDPRDTTSPAGMAALMARLIFRDLPPDGAKQLRGWMESSKTGSQRIRAGLAQGWTAGDKTGSCGTAYNDVAVLRSPQGKEFVLAVYLDRPTVGKEESEAAIAEATRATLAMLGAAARPTP